MLRTIALVCMLALSAGSAKAQDSVQRNAPERNFEIAFNPAGLILSRFGGTFKFKVSDRIALEVPFSAGVWLFGSSSTSNFTWWSVYSGLGARFYLSDTAFKSGWYVETVLQLGYSRVNDLTGAFVVNPWFLGGYGWYFDSGLAINLGIGVQINYFTEVASSQPSWITFPLPVVEASIGYSW